MTAVNGIQLVLTRKGRWAAGAAVAVILVAAGFWASLALSATAATRAATWVATPRVRRGVVLSIAPTGDFVIRLDGGGRAGYVLPSTVDWRNGYGVWSQGTGRPGCMRPGTRGQRISVGVVLAEPSGGSPGEMVLAWLACPAQPVPRFPVVTPAASGR